MRSRLQPDFSASAGEYLPALHSLKDYLIKNWSLILRHIVGSLEQRN